MWRYGYIYSYRSRRPKVILPEVMLPETGVILPEIHCYVARNPESHRPKFYRVYKLKKKVTTCVYHKE